MYGLAKVAADDNVIDLFERQKWRSGKPNPTLNNDILTLENQLNQIDYQEKVRSDSLDDLISQTNELKKHLNHSGEWLNNNVDEINKMIEETNNSIAQSNADWKKGLRRDALVGTGLGLAGITGLGVGAWHYAQHKARKQREEQQRNRRR